MLVVVVGINVYVEGSYSSECPVFVGYCNIRIYPNRLIKERMGLGKEI